MSTDAKRKDHDGVDIEAMFNIQVCSNDGRMLSEYTLTRGEHDIHTLNAAESCACENLSDYQGEPLVVVVSEETLTKLRQVQTDCQTGKSYRDNK